MLISIIINNYDGVDNNYEDNNNDDVNNNINDD